MATTHQSAQTNDQLLKQTLLLVIVISVALSFFFWVPTALTAVWLRRLWLFVAGAVSVAYLLAVRPKKIHLGLRFSLVASLVIVSSLALLRRGPIADGLVGQPTIHPGLLSLCSAIALGLVMSIVPDKKKFFSVSYYLLCAFAALNLVNFIVAHPGRLGVLGAQINYTASLLLVALVIGNWLLHRGLLKLRSAGILQTLLFGGILLNQSRVAVIGATILYVLFLYRCQQKSGRKATLLIALLPIIFGALAIGSLQRLHNTTYLRTSGSYRGDLVRAAVITKPSQLWLGGGADSLQHNIGKQGLKYPLLAKDLHSGLLFESSHNYFVDLLAERGVFVLLLFCILVLLSFRQAIFSSDPNQKLFGSILLVSLFFLFFNNINPQQEVIVWGSMMPLLMWGRVID